MDMKSVVILVGIVVLIALFVLFMTFPGCSGDHGVGKSGLAAPPAGTPTASAVTQPFETVAS